MATKHLRPWVPSSSDEYSSEEEERTSDDGSSSEEDETKVVTNPQTLSKSVVAAPTAKTKVKSSESKEEDDKEENDDDEGSSDEDEPKEVTKPQTLSGSVVAAAAIKTKATLSEENDKDDKEESFDEEDNQTLSNVIVAAAKTDKAKKKEVCVSRKAQKRASEGTEDMNSSKRVKTDKKQTPLFQRRLLSEEDELVFLRRILDFKKQTGKTTKDDKKGFYKFVKDSLQVEVSFSQCIEKVRSLRKKYGKKVLKGKKPKPSSLNAHDKKTFKLSQKIWGSEFLSAEESRKSESIKKLEKDKEDWLSNSVLLRLVSSFSVDEDTVKKMWGLVPTEKKKKMQEKWRVLETKQFKLVSQKTEFMNEVASVMVKASSSH